MGQHSCFLVQDCLSLLAAIHSWRLSLGSMVLSSYTSMLRSPGKGSAVFDCVTPLVNSCPWEVTILFSPSCSSSWMCVLWAGQDCQVGEMSLHRRAEAADYWCDHRLWMQKASCLWIQTQAQMLRIFTCALLVLVFLSLKWVQ